MRHLSLLTPLAACAVTALNDSLASLLATNRLARGYYPYSRMQTSAEARASCRTLQLPLELDEAVTSRVAAMHDLADIQRSVMRCLHNRPRVRH